jgi:hypothetical protein
VCRLTSTDQREGARRKTVLVDGRQRGVFRRLMTRARTSEFATNAAESGVCHSPRKTSAQTALGRHSQCRREVTALCPAPVRPNESCPTTGLGGGNMKPRDVAGLTDQTLSCAARAHVPKPERRSACTHVSRATQAARRRRVLILTSRLGRRTEAGPRQLLRRVGPLFAPCG